MDPFNQTSTAFLSNSPDPSTWPSTTPTYLTYALAFLLVTLLTTRVLSSQHTRPQILPSGTLLPPQIPYWLPLLGHIPSMAWDAATFTRALRTRHPKGIFALNLLGARHNVISAPALATALLNHRDGKAGSEDVARGIMVKVFGLPAAETARYDAGWPELLACYRHILSEPGLGTMVARTAGKIRENVVFLASFSASPVDQMAWERTGETVVTQDRAGEEVVEASMLPLIRDFCAHTANPTIMGTNFLANYPDFFEDIWTVDRAFLLLGSGLPRWVPIPQVTRAHIAKKKILDSLDVFHRAMEKEANGEDPGADWRDLDDVGALVKARMDVYRKHGFSIRARAATEHSLMWAANANSNALIFWLLNRIYADKELLRKLREETSPYVDVVQPKQELAVPEMPQFRTFDVDGLCTKCPLLKSCYVECLRLDTASWSLKVVHEDFVLQSREKDAQRWLLRKGDYAHAAHDLHSTDSAYFPDPMVWKADRHIKYSDDDNRGTADLGSIRPYGGGSSMCKGRAFAFKEVMAFVAAIIALWDMEPKGGGEWKMPRHKKATGVYTTSDDIRVWLKRRKLPQAE